MWTNHHRRRLIKAQLDQEADHNKKSDAIGRPIPKSLKISDVSMNN